MADFSNSRRSLFNGALRLMPLCAALALGSCGATAPGLSTTVDGAFIRAAQTWDLNRDGIVTCEEWRGYARQMFKEVDVNRDGKLTPQEFAKLPAKDRLFDSANFKYFDVNGDGVVTESEFVDRPNPAFTTLDKQGKCQLSTAELRSATTEPTRAPTLAAQDYPGSGKK